MSEFRYDPVKRTWIILAAQRGKRPSQYLSSSQALPEPLNCPFCPGNEAMTPPEVFSYRPPETAPDTPGWRVRVVPNKYPALDPDLSLKSFSEGIWSRIPGFGVHEIVIETPVRNRQMVDMEPEEIAEVLMVITNRMREHFSRGRYKTVIPFKNHGREAGASLVHSHFQIAALPIVPVNVASQLMSFEEHRERKGRCLMCEILTREIEEGARVVLDKVGYLVLAPFAAASPFQLNIVPRDHNHDLTLSDDGALEALAEVLGETLKRLRAVLGEHPWNMVLYNAPANLDDGRDATAYHWFMEITPRLTSQAGFEMGSGILINTVAPEECAALLREVRIQNPESRRKE